VLLIGLGKGKSFDLETVRTGRSNCGPEGPEDSCGVGDLLGGS
jgi:hypothetical protein